MTFYDILWIFLFYSFVGWCCEVVYAAVSLGKFVNRGFLNGPVCPIYGFGMLLVVAALTPISHNLPLLFIGSVVLTSAIEFIGGFILEKFFGEKWWDYTDEPFNVKGYICLKFSLLWGLGCVFVMAIVQPIVTRLIVDSHSTVGWIVAFIGLALMLTDTVLTVTATVRMKNRLHKLDEITARIKVVSDKIGGQLADSTLTVKEKYDEGKEKYSGELDELKEKYAGELDELKEKYTDELTELKEKLRELTEHSSPIMRRLLNSFPKLRTGIHSESIQRLFDFRKNDKK